jgi:hypothetical protein
MRQMRLRTTLISTAEVRQDRVGRGVLEGVTPLAVVLVWMLLTLAALALARQLTAGLGFVAQQTTAMIIAFAGLVLAALCFGVSCVIVLRQVSVWQRVGGTRQAAGALWTLAAVAFVVALPVIFVNVVSLYP